MSPSDPINHKYCLPTIWPTKRLMKRWSIWNRTFRGHMRILQVAFAMIGLTYTCFISPANVPACSNLKSTQVYFDLLNVLSCTYFGVTIFVFVLCPVFHSPALAAFYYSILIVLPILFVFLLIFGTATCSIWNWPNTLPMVSCSLSVLMCTLTIQVCKSMLFDDLKYYHSTDPRYGNSDLHITVSTTPPKVAIADT